MGRPKKTTDNLPDKWQEIILDIYKVGGCDVEVRAALGGMSDDWFYRMIEEDNDFSLTIKKGHVFAEAWWRMIGRIYLKPGELNTGLYAINMRNRFNWFDANRTGESIENMGIKLERIAGALEKFDEQAD